MGNVRKFNRLPRRRGRSWVSSAIAVIVLAVILFFEFGFPLIGCNVKGNISFNTGERIYHVPGQEYYSETVISWFKGERWFCSEKTAREAGWRKARQ